MKVSRKRIGLFLIVLLLLILTTTANGFAKAPLNYPLDMEGTIRGANYKLRVPEGWNGTLIVYAHGFRDKADGPGETDNVSAEAAPGGELFEDALLSMGYAVAGSAYKDNGWAVREGIADTHDLTQFFAREVGEPTRTILWGFSMGSVVTYKSAELYPNLYDGTIAACAVGAGASRAWDGSLVATLAYDVAFGMPQSWGTPADLRDDLDFDTEVLPVLFGQVTEPANFGKFEFMRMVSGLPPEDFYSGSNFLFTDMYFFTEARAELERRAGGPVGQNLDHHYSLTAAEKGYLAALGVDADDLLSQMNDRRNINGRSRRYTHNFADYTGNISNPMLSIHTYSDGLVPVQHQAAYRDTVAAAGQSDNLVQAYTDAVGHCAFTPEQLITSIVAMDYWLDTGVAPGDEFFAASLGFLPDFEPAPWPQP